MEWRRYGRDAILVEFAQQPNARALQRSRALVRALTERPLAGLRNFVPGYTTLLLEFDLPPGKNLAAIAQDSIEFLARNVDTVLPEGPLHRIQVKYSGPDLNRVAERNDLHTDEVAILHSERIYHVCLLGFSPGFPYLGELNPKLRTPRLASPRPKVPAGSVAIGGEHTGIYTVESPGGWNIIGQTEFKVFDLARAKSKAPEEAFALKVGDRVQFVPI